MWKQLIELKKLFEETATNDFEKLGSIFKNLYTNHKERINYIQTVYNRINNNHSLKSVKKQLEQCI